MPEPRVLPDLRTPLGSRGLHGSRGSSCCCTTSRWGPGHALRPAALLALAARPVSSQRHLRSPGGRAVGHWGECLPQNGAKSFILSVGSPALLARHWEAPSAGRDSPGPAPGDQLGPAPTACRASPRLRAEGGLGAWRPPEGSPLRGPGAIALADRAWLWRAGPPLREPLWGPEVAGGPGPRMRHHAWIDCGLKPGLGGGG